MSKSHNLILKTGDTLRNKKNKKLLIVQGFCGAGQNVVFTDLLGQTSILSKNRIKEEYEKVIYNNVDKPKHYSSGNIECIDAMIEAYGKEAVMHFCQCNAFKYQWRFDKKNGIEDLKKAIWYNNKYIKLKETNE